MKNFTLTLLLVAAMLIGYTSAWAQSASVAVTQAPCNNNGILTATFTGLTTPLDVTWHVGSNTVITHNGVNSLTDVLNNYSGAPGYVSVRDANNTYTYAGFNGAPPFTYSVNIVPGICPASGTATATITGGAAPYTIQWKTNPGGSIVSTANPASLPDGFYDVDITDANGCTYGSSAKGDSIYTYSTTNITYNVSSTVASCTNGTATVANISGGASPYSILWSNSATSATINNLVKGYYSVTVTDAQGCAEARGVFIQQSKQIGVNTTPTPTTCTQNDGAIIAFGSGGKNPYTYQWNNSVTTQSQTGLSSGYYRVRVTDADGCIGDGGGYVTSSTPINVTYSTTASSCTTPNGSATLAITGGATPYSVQWYTSPAQSGTTLSNVAAGNYSFKVTDANGCIRTGTANVPPVNVINANITSSNTSCTQNNGSISVSPSGGTTPYTYSWSNSATTPSINNLAAGSYSVTITDNVGCSITKSKYIAVNSPVNIGFNTSPTSCIYSSNGTATATPWGGTPPYSYLWNTSATTPAINSLATGRYGVTVTDANGCKAYNSTYVSYNPANNSCYCTITGTVYDDANNNCTQDVGEQGIPNIRIHCSGRGYAYTDANGNYSFKVPSGSYTITETVQSYYPLSSCQNSSANVTVSASPNCVQTVDFANNVNPIHDMYISTWNYTCPVPGYQYKQKCIIKNLGTVNEPNLVAGYLTDGQILAPSFTPSNLFTGSGNYYDISGGSMSLAPNNAQTFMINYNVPTNIPLNTSLVFKDTTAYTSPMTNWLNDYSPWNNVNYYTPIVVGSYDPNFKEVIPAGMGKDGIITQDDTVLQYMVHFQNLGTYKAQTVYILDTLDQDLDWATFKPIYQSHDCKVTMSEGGVVRFQFDNIDLPHKDADEEGSNGMVVYSIHTKKSLPIGTQFKNTAAIYFDFNEPVITNTTVNTIGPLSVKNIAGQTGAGVSVYPNPTSDVFTVKVDKGYSYDKVTIMNMTGQTLNQKTVSSNETTLSLSGYAQGLYFVILEGNSGTVVRKVEKL